MNTFALEIFDDQGQVCTFFTVRWEDATLSETDKFFKNSDTMNNSKIHYENWQAFLKWSLEMNMERWNISSDLKMLHKHFPLRVLTKCKIIYQIWKFPPPIVLLADFRKLGGIVQWWGKNSWYSTRRKNKYGISGGQYFRQTYFGRITAKRNLHYY